MQTISLCMIVKNEEAVLARCLDSLAGIFDEMIIVDTGSDDRTKEIAKRYTDKVYDFTWVNDFSAARNFSISKASCDYIYTADADEVLDAENHTRFLALKEALLPEVEIVEFAYIQAHAHNVTANSVREFRPKLFRRLRPFVFMDPVHEVLRIDPIVFRSDIEVLHLAEGSHASRDLSIFTRVAKSGNMSARLTMMYARELLAGGTEHELAQAEGFFAALLEREGTASPKGRAALCVLSQFYAMLSNGEKLFRIAMPGVLSGLPAEVCCALGDYFLAEDGPHSAAGFYGAALSAEPELLAACMGREPLLGLAACMEAVGDDEAAEEYRRQAAEWRAEDAFPGLE